MFSWLSQIRAAKLKGGASQAAPGDSSDLTRGLLTRSLSELVFPKRLTVVDYSLEHPPADIAELAPARRDPWLRHWIELRDSGATIGAIGQTLQRELRRNDLPLSSEFVIALLRERITSGGSRDDLGVVLLAARRGLLPQTCGEFLATELRANACKKIETFCLKHMARLGGDAEELLRRACENIGTRLAPHAKKIGKQAAVAGLTLAIPAATYRASPEVLSVAVATFGPALGECTSEDWEGFQSSASRYLKKLAARGSDLLSKFGDYLNQSVAARLVSGALAAYAVGYLGTEVLAHSIDTKVASGLLLAAATLAIFHVQLRNPGTSSPSPLRETEESEYGLLPEFPFETNEFEDPDDSEY